MSERTVTITLTLPELDLVRDYVIHTAMSRELDTTPGPEFGIYQAVFKILTDALVAQGIKPRWGSSL